MPIDSHLIETQELWLLLPWKSRAGDADALALT